MKAWYFATGERKLRYGDNRPIVVGETHSVSCKPVLCESGLHGSIRIIDALRYAPGTILYSVDIEGDVQVGEDKICGISRTYLQEMDANDVLFRFSRIQAKANIEKIRPHVTERDYELIIRWLETGDPSIKEAVSDTAFDTIWKHVGVRDGVVNSGAISASWGVIYSTMFGAYSSNSARNMAYHAIWGAESSAVSDAANDLLTGMVQGEMK